MPFRSVVVVVKLSRCRSLTQTVVETDVSNIILRRVISQPDELGRLYLIIFYSRKFNPTESNYNIYNKELLAIVDCFK